MKMANSRGFTLAEVLTTSAVMVLVFAAVMTTCATLCGFARDAISQASLQSQTRVVVERIARTAMEASDAECLNDGNTLILTFDPGKMGGAGALERKRFRLSNGDIYSCDNLELGMENVILRNVDLDRDDTFASFDSGDNMLTINVQVKKAQLNTEQVARVITMAGLRNAD